jgi:hypothetical protein
VCSLCNPPVEFYFELLAERFNPDDLDDRLFRLSEIPTGSAETLHTLWGAAKEADRRRAEQFAEGLKMAKRPTGLVILSRDMESIGGCWVVDPDHQAVADWFSFLGIRQVVSPGAE